MAFWSTSVTILLALGFAAAGQEPIQLDESCTATVGNQTVFIRPDGTFLVRNISIFQSRVTGVAPQLYRVRATCLRDGQMITGQSDFFSLTPSRTRFVGDVFPSELDPIPVRISAGAPADFVPLGASVQLSVLATLPDGGVQDVTSRAAGTTYLSTNPNLLTVTENGLVTGANNTTSPQTGTIAILNEGNLATISFTAVGPSNDFDNDGLPNDYEELFGLNPFANDANGDLDGDGLTNIEEFNLGTLPNNPDTDLDGIPDGIDGDPLHPEEGPPTVTVTSPSDGSTLFEGQTISFSVDARDDGLLTSVDLEVNGVILGGVSGAPARGPFEFAFTVPFAADFLEFGATASDSVGNAATGRSSAFVVADPKTTVQGLVVDRDGAPVDGAEVTLKLGGLEGEFFDFDTPLTTLPDLSGLTPDATKPVSTLNFLNPGSQLSPDTFGVGFSPDFAGRFTGRIRIPQSGTYTFTLGADDGARLTIDGVVVVEAVATGEFVEATGAVNLLAGEALVEVAYFQAVEAAELQLSVRGPGATEDSILLPTDLRQATDSLTAVTAPDGSFSFADVPSILGAIRAGATAILGGEEATGESAAVDPRPGDTTDLGEIVIASDARVLVFGDRFEKDLLANDLISLGHDVTNVSVLPPDLSAFDTIWHVGAFVPLSAAEQARLADFLASGGGIHLTGERPCCEALNDSLQSFVNGVVVAGGITVGDQGDIGSPYAFNPDAAGGVTTTPNLLSTWNPSASGGMAGLGALPDPHILATGRGSVPVGGVWQCDDLVAGRGKLTLLMDVNWFRNGGRLPVIEDIQEFLFRACP